MEDLNQHIKVACVIHSLHLGGMERVMSILINDFVDRPNVEVHLILIGRKREVEFELDERIRIHKPSFEFQSHKRTRSTLKTLGFIRKKVKEIQPTTILSFGEYWNNLVLLGLLDTSFRVFISDRSEPNKNMGRLNNWLRDKLYPKAAGYIAQTQKAAEIAKKNNWNKNIEIIGNPINLQEGEKPNSRENIVLSVGRLIETKHFDTLIKVFSNLNLPNWKLIICGGNAKNKDLLTELKILANEHKPAQIELTGKISNIEEYYKKAKIFAFTSSSEGFPNVIGEALSYGLPVVAYDCDAGPSDMIEDHLNGFLIQTHDEKAFQEKLKRLIENEDLRDVFSSNSKFKIKEFSKEKIINRFFHFITQTN